MRRRQRSHRVRQQTVSKRSRIFRSDARHGIAQIIQREVPDNLRASAFARSETMLQLAWVIGGAFGIALPPTGWLGFTVAAALLVLAVGLILWSQHRGRAGSARFRQPAVSPDSPTTPVGPSWS